MNEILFLKPVCTHNIWGGTRLREEYGYPVEGDDIGECWGISAHPDGDGTICSGIFAGKKLSELYRERPDLFGNLDSDRFPLMAKIIDARDDLSIQVHPDDAYAKVHENGSLGKTEGWYILDCPKDATLVIGHHARTREELSDMIRNGRWHDFIAELPIKKGDYIQIDPGTVHAIKGGVLLLEVQQNSNITYRVYDYDRLSNGKPRELHVDKSIDVITVPARPAEELKQDTTGFEANRLNLLHSCRYYDLFELHVASNMTFEQRYPFLMMSAVEGRGTLNGTPVKKGDHMILPNHFGTVTITGNLQFIAATVNIFHG
jgi:beta-glucosidase